MPEELTDKEKQYLRERSFEIIYAKPTEESSFPYVVLNKLQNQMPNAGIVYWKNRNSSAVCLGKIHHPSNTPEDSLIKTIEKVVAERMDLEGVLFTTNPGEPIKVFVADDAWKQVAEQLAAKYK